MDKKKAFLARIWPIGFVQNKKKWKQIMFLVICTQFKPNLNQNTGDHSPLLVILIIGGDNFIDFVIFLDILALVLNVCFFAQKPGTT